MSNRLSGHNRQTTELLMCTLNAHFYHGSVQCH